MGNAKINSSSMKDYEELMKQPKRKKYNNQVVTIDEMTFHSKFESSVYLILKDMKKCGEIKGFERQVTYLLQEGYRDEYGKWVRPITYTSDFDITHNDDSLEVIETKGYETETYRIKAKLFKKRYPHIKFRVIKRGDPI